MEWYVKKCRNRGNKKAASFWFDGEYIEIDSSSSQMANRLELGFKGKSLKAWMVSWMRHYFFPLTTIPFICDYDLNCKENFIILINAVELGYTPLVMVPTSPHHVSLSIRLHHQKQITPVNTPTTGIKDPVTCQGSRLTAFLPWTNALLPTQPPARSRPPRRGLTWEKESKERKPTCPAALCTACLSLPLIWANSAVAGESQFESTDEMARWGRRGQGAIHRIVYPPLPTWQALLAKPGFMLSFSFLFSNKERTHSIKFWYFFGVLQNLLCVSWDAMQGITFHKNTI